MNLMVGMDIIFLFFLGVGIKGDKVFGFVSCERYVGVLEGVNVFIEKKNVLMDEFVYGVFNIEYIDFD